MFEWKFENKNHIYLVILTLVSLSIIIFKAFYGNLKIPTIIGVYDNADFSFDPAAPPPSHSERENIVNILNCMYGFFFSWYSFSFLKKRYTKSFFLKIILYTYMFFSIFLLKTVLPVSFYFPIFNLIYGFMNKDRFAKEDNKKYKSIFFIGLSFISNIGSLVILFVLGATLLFFDFFNIIPREWLKMIGNFISFITQIYGF